MNWELFYLVCFVIGFALSALSFLTGFVHIHLPFRLHIGHHYFHAPNTSAGVSFLNGFTITIFLAWFGAAGYLLSAHTTLWPFLALVFASLSGLVGALIIFLFLVKVMLPHEKALNQADFEMVGVLGRVNSSIRSGGTGELVFTLQGTRRSCAARTEDGAPLPKGSEVVVTRFERGIAYVKTWDELASDFDDPASQVSGKQKV